VPPCHTGGLIAPDLDYDVPFLPVVMAEATEVAPADPGMLLPGGGPPTAPGP
jgi:glutamate transport system permease protein